MSPPIDPTTAQASRSANERTVQEWLDTLLAGACDQRAFRMQVDDLLRGSADAAWEVLSVLDQYYRRGKIKTDLFHALKLHVERQALGAGEDSDTSAQSPLARDLLRASNMTVPVGATLPRPSLVPRPAAAAPDAATAPRRAERSDRNRVPAVGDVLRGRYRIVGVLGQGGMGTVFEAVDLDRVDLAQTSQKLAIKVLHTAVTMRPQLFAELRSEFQHLQSLSHPNIVRVHEFDRDGDTAFFTMELLLGSSLGQLIATQDGRTLDRSQALAIIRDVGAALVHAHSRGVVHGDINPQNIFVTRDGEVRVLDFGASHKLQHGPWIAEFELRQPIAVASPGYASCQQLEGEVAEARDDVYAFACIIYMLLAGRHPFQGRTALDARALRLTAPHPAGMAARQWRVLQEGLRFERDRRPSDVRDWLERLQLGAPSGRSKLTIALAIGAVAVGLIVAASWLKNNEDFRAPSTTASSANTATNATGDSRPTPITSTDRAPPAAAAAPAVVPSSEPAPAPSIPAASAPAASAPAASPPTAPPPAAPPPAAPPPTAPPPSASVLTTPPATALPSTAPPSTAPPSTAPPSTAPPSTTPPPAASPAAPRVATAAASAIVAPTPALTLATHARVELAAAVVEVSPSDAFALVTVRRKGSMRGAASFTWWTESGTAKPGADFASIAPHVERIADGKSSINLIIPVVSDSTRRVPKSFYVLIDEAAPGTAVVERTTTMVTIQESQ
jgi:serine/threonine protein kinase